MRVDLGNKTIFIRFEYTKENRRTDCIIDEEGNKRLGYGTVRYHSGDVYSKIFGRKVAFQQAVAGIESRSLRSALWRTFLSKCKIPSIGGKGVMVKNA